MASEWIKMRPGMQRHAKITAMARQLLADPAFIEWFFGVTPDRHDDTSRVTSVTFSIVTRVTVAALLDVWGAINHVVKDDDRVPFMAPEDVDHIAGIPGFASAMQRVEWLTVDDENCLVFPNFGEFNTPEASRKPAKSQAQRAKEYRERKKAKQSPTTDRHDRHETSRGVEKSRYSSAPLRAPAREAVADETPADQPPAASSSETLGYGEIVSVLTAHGLPYQFAMRDDARRQITGWSEAGVTSADLAEAWARAHAHKRDGPIGPGYLDPIVKQVVAERLNPNPKRASHGTNNSGHHRPGSSADYFDDILAQC